MSIGEDQIKAKLTECTKVSAIQKPNLRGQTLIGRLVHVSD